MMTASHPFLLSTCVHGGGLRCIVITITCNSKASPTEMYPTRNEHRRDKKHYSPNDTVLTFAVNTPWTAGY